MYIYIYIHTCHEMQAFFACVKRFGAAVCNFLYIYIYRYLIIPNSISIAIDP